MHKKIPWVKVLSFLGAAVFLLGLIYQLASLKMNAVTTETVVEKTEQDAIAAKIFVVRDEQYIINDALGTVVPLVEDGKKVAVGDTVAVICKNPDEASAYIEEKELIDNIIRYNQLNGKQNENAPDIEKIDSEADLLFADMLGTVSSGKLENLKSKTAAFRDKLTRRQITIDGSIDFSQKIKSLENKLQKLKQKEISAKNLLADKTGYYINSLDGYEKAIPYAAIKQITVSDVEKAFTSSPAVTPINALGKLNCNYDWYMLACLSRSDAAQLKEGRSVKIAFGEAYGISVSAKVYSLNPSQSGKICVVFVCNLMNNRLAGIRMEDARIILKEYKGYKINSSAVRVLKGTKGAEEIKGAYVLLGNVITFRKFDILYTGDNYILATPEKNTYKTGKPKYVELYDEVVVKGKNLKEGRVVD